jgi:hypothetical protein
MGLTREQAEKSLNEFNAFYDKLTREEQLNWYKGHRPTIEEYERCFRCNAKKFRPAIPGDCPDGCTIQPVIYEETVRESDQQS